MAFIGYARVSSTGQSLDVQIKQLTEFGCGVGDNRIFQEKKSGSKNDRKELKACLTYVREGDTLVVTRLDRLARSMLDLTNIVADLESRGIQFKVLNQEIDTSTNTGKLMFHLLSAIAEFEVGIRRERQADGIALAQAKGVKFGVKAKHTPEQVQEMVERRRQGVLIKDLMADYGLSKATVYRLMGDQVEKSNVLQRRTI